MTRLGIGVIAALLSVVPSVAAQDDSAFEPPRLENGRPNLRGIWMNGSISAAFDVETHPDAFGTRGGQSAIVDPPDGTLPYLPGARELAQDNNLHRERDPVSHCHPHGPPRAMLPPFPMQIVQDGDYVVFLYETEHGVRIVPTDGRPHLEEYSSWSGDSRGRWEADTLVIEVIGLNGRQWLDQAGNYLDANARVTERLTMTGPDSIEYEATVEDPTVYSQPWTIRVPLRRRPPDVELLEYGCIEGDRDFADFVN